LKGGRVTIWKTGYWYGYMKDPEDKHRLLVDPEAAEVVKQIYI
jgi:hypothetical protein